LKRHLIFTSDDDSYFNDDKDLSVVNIQDPLNPVVERYSERMGGLAVGASDNYLVTAGGYGGIDFVNIADIVNCYRENNISVFVQSSIVLKDDYAIISCDETKKENLLDISDPYHPTILGPFLDNASNIIAVHEDLLFCIIDDEKHLMDISDPLNPIDLCTFELEGASYSTLFHDDYMYVSIRDNGKYLRVIDISNPSVPVVINQISIPKLCRGMAVIGNHIISFASPISSDCQSLIMAFDISEPESPVLVNDFFISYNILASAYTSETAYFIIEGGFSYYKEFQIWDISDPMNIYLKSVNHLPYSKDTYDIEVSEPFVFISQHIKYPDQGLLSVFDVSDPDNPAIVDSIECYAEDMIKRDNFIYAVHPNHGFSIVKLWD